MGIEIIKAPAGQSFETPGPLSLPVEFDREALAVKWVKEGPAVAAAAQRQAIPGSFATADGWEVWRDSTGKPYKVPLQNGTYVLLCRDGVVQKAVNAICGNIGKERLSSERKGDTVAGSAATDPGLLNDDRLAKVIGREEVEEGDVVMNRIPDTSGGSQRVSKPLLTTKAAVKPQSALRRTRR